MSAPVPEVPFVCVITMGCGDTCPVFPGQRYLDWDVPDPAGKSPDRVRPIRDDIDTKVRELLASFAAGGRTRTTGN
jgi:arsenate reductase (thioredoxin)